MTQRLKILGPYTPEHEGPFCTRDGKPVRIICTDRKGMPPIVSLVQDDSMEMLVAAKSDGVAVTMSRNYDLMNAREVPVAREFWVNEYEGVVPKNAVAHRCEKDARSFEGDPSYIRTIHVREVLPGEDE